LGTPQVTDFDGWKEEEEKFLMSQYHNGHLWLYLPISIMGGMIHRITKIPHGCTPIPKTMNPKDWIQTLTKGTSTKKSKRVVDKQIHGPLLKIDMHYTVVFPYDRWMILRCEANDVRTYWVNLLVVGTSRLGRTNSHINQEQFQIFPRKCSNNKIPITSNLDFHEPSLSSQGIHIYFTEIPDYEKSLIFFIERSRIIRLHIDQHHVHGKTFE